MEWMQSSSWLDALATVLVDVVMLKATLMVSAVALLCLVLRGKSASVRAGAWSGLFLVLLVLPGLALVPVPFEVHPEATGASTMTAAWSGSGSTAGPPVGGGAREAFVRRTVAPVEGWPAWRPGAVRIESSPAFRLLIALWAVGALVVWGGDLRAMSAARRLIRRGRRPGPGLQRELAGLAASMGMSRAPRAVCSTEVQIPSVCGRLRPVLLLPGDMKEWPREARESALLHELAHLRRGDLLVHAVSRAVLALYWLNPVVRYAALRLHAEREQACDDGVVSRLGGALDYASVLVALARSTQGPAPALSFTDRSALAERVRSLVDPARPRNNLGPWARGLLVCGGGLALVGALALDLVAVAPQDPGPVVELSSQDPLVRQRAAWRLGEMEDRDALRALSATLSDPDARVRRTSAWALGEIKDDRALDGLARLLEDERPPRAGDGGPRHRRDRVGERPYAPGRRGTRLGHGRGPHLVHCSDPWPPGGGGLRR